VGTTFVVTLPKEPAGAQAPRELVAQS